MIDIIQLVFWWLQDNPTVIAAIIGAIPAIMAALWARSAKQETRPNHGNSLRDAVDQISKRQLALITNDAVDRRIMNDVMKDLNAHYEQAELDREQTNKDREVLRNLVQQVYTDYNDDDDDDGGSYTVNKDFPPQK